MTDDQAIKSTVLDYFEGWFDGDAERMERALHPQLAKRSLGDGRLDEATAPGMIEATAAGFGKRRDPGERRIDIDVVEIYGPIATVVVHSNVYREYLHLGQTDEGWKIVNALWDWA
jgi:hypothetical protein